MSGLRVRILRNYRHLTPTKFHAFNQKVHVSLCDKTRIPDSIWGANLPLVESYCATSVKYDAVYHESMLGSKIDIAQREVLQLQLIDLLDEIAAILEAVAVRNPDVLVASGFDLAKDKRGHTRNKTPIADHNADHTDRGEGGTTGA